MVSSKVTPEDFTAEMYQIFKMKVVISTLGLKVQSSDRTFA